MSWYTLMPKLLNMSLTASIAIVLVILLRMLLRKAPKIISYALWGVVLFRLLVPVSIESGLSLYTLLEVPTAESGALEYIPENIVHREYPAVTLPVPGISQVINSALPQGKEQLVADPLEAPMSITTYIWMIGVLVMVICSMVSYVKLHGKLLASVKLRENIFLADDIGSPFVMGLIRPRIYLPSSLSEKERDYILLHEQHHIRRGDHIVKLLSFAALCLHWFNPLVWAAFILSGKDMEMSCDEAVLRKLGEEIRVDYSASLISLATGRRIIAGTPLAFGEGSTEGRIRNIARWKKPAAWVIVTAGIACVILAVCLITNPMNRDTMLLGAEYRIAEVLYRVNEEQDWDAGHYEKAVLCLGADFSLWEKNPDDDKWTFTGQMEPYALDKTKLEAYPSYNGEWLTNDRIGEVTDAYILRFSDYALPLVYLMFCTNDGDILFGAGMENTGEQKDIALMILLRLESTFGGTHLTGEFHERSLAQTVGGDVEIFHTHYNGKQPNYMIVGFKADDTPYVDGVQLPSAQKIDMGYAVFYQNRDESGYRLLQCCVYAEAGLAKDGIFLCPDPVVLDGTGKTEKTTYDAIIINNRDIARAERIWEYADGREKKQSEQHLNSQQLLLYPRESAQAGCRISQIFYDAQGETIAVMPINPSERRSSP